MTTRCKARFLCWRPQAFVLFRMETDGRGLQPLSFANLSEWTPTVLRDGRLLWMRSEYQDKGANFGHTLWGIRPDGSHPELIFGNNTDHCYANGREVPGTSEIVCTLVSHGGDLNGPIALLDPRQGRFNSRAITSLTPDVPPQFDMNWLRRHCFRDPTPISRDHFLCSHAPMDQFGLYVIDRWGNREVLYLDPDLGSMAPMPLRPMPRPPVLSRTMAGAEPPDETAQFVVADVYRGLEPAVKRGSVKYLRVCQELRADLRRLPNGEYQQDHEPFLDWYATPVHKVSGPHGWPSYVAKGDLGLAMVEADGSANFHAPAGKVLYFQALDAEFNELQRMRSVVQLQPGEKRGCIGCHEHRMTTPPAPGPVPLALQRPPGPLQPPPWGAGPFAYEKVVQPVWDAQCVRCHDAKDKDRINLTGAPDREGVPASYRTIIERGWVRYFDWGWAQRHRKAEPLTFGTVKSRLWQVLAAGHYQVELTRDEMRAVKTWIDLNCPLWPDYLYRPERAGFAQQASRP
jgi:cytochrome c553